MEYWSKSHNIYLTPILILLYRRGKKCRPYAPWVLMFKITDEKTKTNIYKRKETLQKHLKCKELKFI